jgi:cation transport ATPase
MLDQNKNSMDENEEAVSLNENELETASEVAAVNEENIQKNDEEVNEIEEIKEEQPESSVEIKQTAEKKVATKSPFLKSLLATVVDEVIIGIISVALLYLTDFILRAAGYFISGKISMLFIIFVVVSILYPIIMECSKKGNTIGRSLK